VTELTHVSLQIQAALKEQDRIGWFNFLLERHFQHWEHGQCCAARLSMDKTWFISWDM
jgi:hypothetical protein